MYVKRDIHGQIMYYYQDLGTDKESVRFEENEIIEIKNNPFDDYALALDWITQQRLDVEPLVSHILPFEQIQRGFQLAVDKPPADETLKVILQF